VHRGGGGSDGGSGGEPSRAESSHGRKVRGVGYEREANKSERERERERRQFSLSLSLSLSLPFCFSLTAYPTAGKAVRSDDGNKAQASGYLRNQVSEGTLTALIWSTGIPSKQMTQIIRITFRVPFGCL